MAVYAYGAPHDEGKAFVYDSLIGQHISRFLWSWYHDSDLNRLKNVQWDSMTADEKSSWKHGRRLLGFKPGDWVLHKNVPKYGEVTAARLSSEYFYQNPLPAPGTDGRQCFKVDKVFTFNRNDKRVHPDLYRKLKVMGALYQVYSEKEFYQSLFNLGYEFDAADYEATKKAGMTFDDKNIVVEPYDVKPVVSFPTPITETETNSEDIYLKPEVGKILGEINKIIYLNKPGKDFERFLAEVFRKIPGVVEVKENGFGWKPDYGADLIVKYNLERIKGVELIEQTWVVQVKSYTGEHWETNAVKQLETAIDKFDADVGILITTGERTQNLEAAINKLAEDMSKKNVAVYLIAGTEVAQFVLRYGLDLLI